MGNLVKPRINHKSVQCTKHWIYSSTSNNEQWKLIGTAHSSDDNLCGLLPDGSLANFGLVHWVLGKKKQKQNICQTLENGRKCLKHQTFKNKTLKTQKGLPENQAPIINEPTNQINHQFPLTSICFYHFISWRFFCHPLDLSCPVCWSSRGARIHRSEAAPRISEAVVPPEAASKGHGKTSFFFHMMYTWGRSWNGFNMF